ncbi:1,2-dihydroxy-3-keto-5-methylthiopentene dioxygenase [Smittium mucronatum]|uniref:acireductone dioxygenase (Fe(2+)-requiring) n=1 Tax=Smittium mucronatum TaxID=133383 RepID=A0A1R0GW41_9FUNG|nr:1,2-dihydroxy-3-keto-5-methylthiopentene dioxygenase [Smittium mucronatum]
MRAYYYLEDGTSKCLPHDSNDIVTSESLISIGFHHISVFTKSQLEELCFIHKYVPRESISIDSSFDKDQLDRFFKEHIHENEEVRFITAGEGYFDIRDANDKWIRIHATAGDLMIFPAGIYHRFTPTNLMYIESTRFSKDYSELGVVPRPIASDNKVRKIYESKIKNHVIF